MRVRRDVFLAFGGLDESYDHPSIEDIEFGTRLIADGRKIELDPAIQVKHLKRWTLLSMMRTDIRDRGIPWTLLILRLRSLPDDLNVRRSQRASVALAGLLIGLAGAGYFIAAGICLVLLVATNASFYRFLASRRGILFAIRAVPLHILFHVCCGIAFVAGFAMHLVLSARRPVGAASGPGAIG